MQLKNSPTTLIAALILCLSLSSCSSSEESNSQPPSSFEQPSAAIGTNGRLIPIKSDNVQAAGYDANSLTMTVQFNNGYSYEYYGVPAELWNSFIAAQPHPWSQVGNPRLIGAGVPYKRIS